MKFDGEINKKIDKFLEKNPGICLHLSQICDGHCAECKYVSQNCKKQYKFIIENTYRARSRSNCLYDINGSFDCLGEKSCYVCFNHKLISFGLKLENNKLELL